MREIKFRAWDKNLEFMIDPGYLSLDGNGLYAVFYDNCDSEESAWLDEVQDIELMQYTGLKDKSGIEIYEGDIFKISEPPSEINSVVYDRGTWYLMEHGLHLTDECDIGEVIGNIYSNPELLK